MLPFSPLCSLSLPHPLPTSTQRCFSRTCLTVSQKETVIYMGVREGTYGTYAYVPDVGLRMMSDKDCHKNILGFSYLGQKNLKNILLLYVFEPNFVSKLIELVEFEHNESILLLL